MVAGSPMSSRNTVTSMSSEKRLISPNPLDREVPPLKRRRGPPSLRPLNKASSVQHTQNLLDILGCCAEAQRRRIKSAQHRVQPGRKNLIESRVHAFALRVAPRLVVGFFRLKSGFGFGRATAA